MKLSNKKPLIKNVVFISGLTRSGKSLMLPIISSFNNTGKVNVDFDLEQIPMIHHLGELKDDVAKYLLQSRMNSAIYDDAIGRNSNFRPNDYTSVWQNKNPMEYVQRLFLQDGDAVINKLSQEDTIFPMMVHNGLWHADIWFKALPDLKFIHMQRNPIDIVFSWIRKGYGGEMYHNPRLNIVTYQFKETLVPYYAFGWEDVYLSLPNIDRIIYMVKYIRTAHEETYQNLDDNFKNQILFISHQDLITKTEDCLQKVANFIGEGPSLDTSTVLLEQNCPRSFNKKTPFSTNNKSREEKLIEIKTLVSPEAYNLLLNMNKQFESQQQTI